jgi:hypothetical protein
MGAPREIKAIPDEVPDCGFTVAMGSPDAAAFVADPSSVELPSEPMVIGVAVDVSVAIPAGWTVSTADDEADPPAPLQVRVYVTL